MEGKLYLCEDCIGGNYFISKDFKCDYAINIMIEGNEKIEDIINNSKELEESIEMDIDINEECSDEYEKERYYFYKSILGKGKELMKNAHYMEFDLPIDKTILFINNNKEFFKDKKIILNEEYFWNEDILNLIKEKIENLDNIYFNINENDNYIEYSECFKTYHMINKIKEKVELYNFSPLEKIMYVYDLVRNRVYTEEGKNEDSTTSRDLTSVLLGDKIVCVGYSKIFNKILDSLGIDTYLYYLKGKNNNCGHVRSLMCVKDDKYNVDGVYLFDTTWDSKKSENSKNYLYSYRYFAKTIDEFEKYDDSNDLINNNLSYLDPDFSETVINSLKSKDIAEKFKFYGKVNHLRRLTKKHELFNGVLPFSQYNDTIDYDKLKNEIDEIVNCFYKKIPGETILKLLYNVRKYQYYENPEIYDFSLDTFFNIFINSDFTFTSMTPEERLSLAIFGEFDEVNHYRRNIIKYNNKNELTKDIERVKLAKTLRKVYEKNK